jgi:acetyl-CoA carboxylase carboxyl transferase subunit alpha
MPDLLEFEEPIGVLLKEIEAMSMLPSTPEREAGIESLRRRAESIRIDIYRHLTPWQRVQVARHPARPSVLEYASLLFTDFTEIHGDRRFADDHAIVTGTAVYKGDPVLLVGHHKGGSDTKQKIFRNFGYAKPEGYRKALRAMRLAEKFGRPIIVFVDTPAAYPGVESEERGIAEADRRHYLRRGRQWGSTRHRDRRSDSHARIRGLQRHPTRRLRGDSLARCRP